MSTAAPRPASSAPTSEPSASAPSAPGPSGIDDGLVDEAVAQVRTWLAAARDEKVDAGGRNLAGVLRDPHGLAFTVGFVDGVVRPEDARVAGRNLAGLMPLVPRFLPAPLRALIRVGGALAPIMPRIVVPASRAVLRRMVRHLIVDARDAQLGRTLARIRRDGVRLNVNLLGEAVLGHREAERRLEGTRRLIERDDVDYVSIKVSSTVAPHSPWAFDDAVAHAVEALSPLYELAKANGTFINLDMEEYKDLDLTIVVFTRLLGRPEFHGVEAGIVLQAYLPDALGAMTRLQEWASERTRSGGAPVKVRVVKGANLPLEQVDAETHGWPLATWPTKQHTDASYKAVLEYALDPRRLESVRLGIAGHNLFDIALAWHLARRRGVADGPGVEFEMLLGMATAQAEVVRRDVGGLLLYTPVVHPGEFDVAIAYLIRRLEEGASPENFMSAVFDIDESPELFAREEQRFRASIALMATAEHTPNRVQDRRVPQPEGPRDAFRNAPDTDPSVAGNRAWADAIRERMEHSRAGAETVAAHTLRTAEEVDELIDGAWRAGAVWRALPLAERAAVLHRAGDVLEEHRAELLEVMGSECGKVVEQGDPEVSEAIDFAHYYASSALALVDVDGAEFAPVGLTVVAPPWNFPVAIPAGSTLAALAAGSPVVLKPAPQAARSGSVLAEALWEAGVPRDVLRLAHVSEHDLGRRLVAHERVDRVILTGAYETAELFRSFRADLPLLAETSGKNAVIVTPSADLDLAAKDVAYSAFGHAGQKCSAASLVILVGSAASSERFRRQLVDAVDGYTVGMPWEGPARIGPLIAPAEGKLHRALTELEPGQRWVREPRRLGEALWSPGIREGVRPGSEFHLTEYFGPVLGIMTADTLDEAIDIVRAVDYGLTSGLHALDESEIARWLERIDVGNAYVNRGTTGAIVQRQPFGGWKRSAVGAGTKAGGPSYLYGLGTWADAPTRATGEDAAARRASSAAAGAVEPEQAGWLAGALATDIAAFDAEFGAARDVQALELEQNVLRYAPVPVTVRFDTRPVVELVRVVAAGRRVGAPITVSAAVELPSGVAGWLRAEGVETHVEDAAAWAARAASLAPAGGRVRLVGGSLAEVVAATEGAPGVAVYDGPVTAAGRVEMLPFVREQAVSITAHRFGNVRRYAVPGLADSLA